LSALFACFGFALLIRPLAYLRQRATWPVVETQSGQAK
jgi:hypothetical protein